MNTATPITTAANGRRVVDVTRMPTADLQGLRRLYKEHVELCWQRAARQLAIGDTAGHGKWVAEADRGGQRLMDIAGELINRGL